MILKGKVVIIVGVGPGMGKAMAMIAAQEGATVALGSRNRAYLDTVVAEIVAEGGDALALSTDVTDFVQCDALVTATMERWGRVDGLVNSAYAPGENGAFDDANVESWMHTIDVACLGAARMAQAVLPHMAAQGGGAIVNVATMQSQKPLPGGSLSYAIAKGALVSTSRQLAAEMAKYNIRVNATRMGWLWGEPVRNALKNMAEVQGTTVEALQEGIARNIPLGVIPPEEECAKSVLILISDYTKMVTGAVLDINGGEWMAP
jgi:NAD(P)-dependent dehydrogenase (short-subunit alcohol dehydrogenase family)